MRAEDQDPSTGLIELHGRRAMITGAARGIGLRVAELLGAAGASVCLSDRDTIALDGAVASLRARDLPVTGSPADVTVPADLDRLVATAAGPAGQLDIVVANAGRMTTGGVRETGPDEWEEGLRANLTSAFLTCRAAVPALQRSPAGRLVLLSSGAGFDPRTVAGVSYAVAKAGVAHLGRLLSVELAGTGITVNVVAPGAVDTSMARGFGDDVIAELARRSPLGRIATPDDVARVVLFLASDLGGFVNGEVVRVAGGP